MTETPILFSGAMVRAILANTKTQTRRVVSALNCLFDGHPNPKSFYQWAGLDWSNAWVDKGPSPAGNPGPYFKVPYPPEETIHRIYPRWRVGDRLWVKETFSIGESAPYGDGQTDQVPMYRADWEFPDSASVVWRPSIFMPRWAIRINLEITGIRAERLQDISTADIRAEGVTVPEMAFRTGKSSIHIARYFRSHQDRWIALWDSLNQKRGFGWDVNPLVFVLEFKRIDAGGKP